MTGARTGALLPTRLARSSLAAGCCAAGNLLPSWAAGLATVLWSWALRLDRHQEVAAVRRAEVLAERRSRGAWQAFETVLEQAENRWRTSASDLHLGRFPARALRRGAARLLWGRNSPADDAWRDERLRRACTRLAQVHCKRALAAGALDRAARAAAAWKELAGNGPEIRGAFAEIAWHHDPASAWDTIALTLEHGASTSPFDAIRWAERLRDRAPDLAEKCLRRARAYLPEVARVWTLSAFLAWHRGELDRTRLFCERALASDPQDLDAFLLKLRAADEPAGDLERCAGEARLAVEGPAALDLGATGRFAGRLEGVDGPFTTGWTLFVLPPAGWGLLPDSAETAFGGDGRAAVAIAARRPERVRGGAWPLVFLALGPPGYLVARREVRVPDSEPGRVLVTVTEDHEIHEERGAMPVDQLRRLLVDKSRFAANLGLPWTHMVETGSTLALPRWAAERHGQAWRRFERDARRHLIEEIRRGHDVQPHLHAFNDPRCELFPYTVDGDVLRTPLHFLLTSAERRGDWASVCPPPDPGIDNPTVDGHKPRSRPFDRLRSVESSVADLEEVAYQGSPDYRAVLWRSGLLEYGVSAADQAWSAVALRRAGLVAVSDVAKPASPWSGAARAAFPAGWRDSTSSRLGGPLLQLPIAANLEGDYLMGSRLLRRRARKTVASVRRRDGGVRPGVHLFTLITHDKFLNARRGRDEFLLDPDGGDWRTVRRHASAWRDAGATFVTAREGVETVVDDLTWHPAPRLRDACWVEADGDQGGEIRFRLTVLGRGIPVSESFPQHLLVAVPCFLRRHVEAIRTELGGEVATPEVQYLAGVPAAFWIRRTEDRGAAVVFTLRATFPRELFPRPRESGE